ncbi:hypothetical protein EA187_03640 [Lujinxingia sediminis]|uniref:Uncharacterized protein n=1 Tax=Lujinxingia sediminis TaxID=2480984 RepID=A0ABY0CXC3_9DELT|nr:hypothetical protein EA187_03640 [Lujinxingia sediminis]
MSNPVRKRGDFLINEERAKRRDAIDAWPIRELTRFDAHAAQGRESGDRIGKTDRFFCEVGDSNRLGVVDQAGRDKLVEVLSRARGAKREFADARVPQKPSASRDFGIALGRIDEDEWRKGHAFLGMQGQKSWG